MITDSIRRQVQDMIPLRDKARTRAEKKNWSQMFSAVLGDSFAQELQLRGMRPGIGERRLAGGIGAKRVDVSWASEESGLLLGLSIKTLNFRDAKSGTYRKNLTNRRSDLLHEAVTLHRRFPYAVLAGMIIFPSEASIDKTSGYNSSLDAVHALLGHNTGRQHSTGYEEQYEHLYVGYYGFYSGLLFEPVGRPCHTLRPHEVVDELVASVLDRNSELYRSAPGGRIRRR